MSDTAPAVAVFEVSRSYRTTTGVVPALVDITMTAAAHRLTVVAGRSGCGKSTLLRLVAAIDSPERGRIDIDGIDVAAASRRARRRLRRHRIGFVFPQPADNLLAHLDARGNLAFAQRRRADHTPTDEWLARVGLDGHAHSRVSELSGGEQQRLALAIAAVGRPSIVVADEPTAQLDTHTAGELIHFLRHLADSGVTLLVASHDERLIDTGDTVIRLDNGRRIA